MKKILLISLVAASTGLLGYEYPNGQQPATRMPRPTRQQANQASRQEQDRTVQGPRSPRPIVQTPVTTTHIIAAEILLESFSPQRGPRIQQTPANDVVIHARQRELTPALASARPASVIIPRNNFATDPSDSN